MKVTRRKLLCGASCLAGALLLGSSVSGSARRKRSRRRKSRARTRRSDSGPLSGSKLFADVISYYNLGEHRTASEADLRTSQWMLEQLRTAGLKATSQTFSLRQFTLRQTRLTIGGNAIRAFPLWFPRPTGPEPVTGSLLPLGKSSEPGSLRGKIALVTFPASAGAAVQEGRMVLAASNAGASGVVAITESATKEIIAMNTLAGAGPWPIPVVLVGQRDEALLNDAARSNRAASMLVDGEDDPEAQARNVIARVDQGKNLIVVSTPQSGWFRCAGERGPGIALFFGLARWASRRTSGSSFLFVSTSGHELGGLGMSAFLKDVAPARERVMCWIHLGAGIATYSWEETAAGLRRTREPDSNRLLMSSPDLAPLLTKTFAGLGGLTPNVDRAAGEYEFMRRAGYRVFGIAAAHRFHHTPADSPQTTGPEIIESVGRALVRTIESIEQSGSNQ